MTVHGSFEWLEALDARLAGVARGAGALWLSFGLALEALARRGGHHDLGFSSLGAYALERCRRSSRWVQEARTVARRLGDLPGMRYALLSGKLSWSMAVVLSRVATAEDETVWLLLARGRTVRQMKEMVRGLRPNPGRAGHLSAGESGAGDTAGHLSAGDSGGGEAAGEVDDDWGGSEPEPMRTLTITVDQIDAWLFECARMLVGRIGGSAIPDAVLEALLGEAELSMLAWLPQGVSPEIEADPAAAAQRAWEAELERWRREAEVLCEPRIAKAREPEVETVEVPTVEELMLESPEQLDARLRDLADELARRDVEIGRLAERFWRADGWRRLGYATARQYASERLGMSLNSVKNKRELARRLVALPEVARAVESGDVGYEDARLLARVATESTSAVWVERARERTAKHLRGEVAAAKLLARAGDEGAAVPPTVEQVEAIEVLGAKVLSGEVFNDDDGVAEAFRTMLAACGGSPRARARVTLRLRVREGTYWHYKAREGLHRQHGPGGSFVRFLCMSLIETWKGALRSGVAYEHVYARDRFECKSPVCSRRDLTPHHLRYRSHGGDDSPENLLSLCVWCHLRGIHEGRLKATPPASDVRWEIGRNGHTVVEGRRIAA